MTTAPAPALRPVGQSWAYFTFLLIAGLGLLGLSQFFGNSTRGYYDSSSLFFWWAAQWPTPGQESEHGPLLVAVALYIFFINVLRGLPAPLPKLGRVEIGLVVAAVAIFFGMAEWQKSLPVGIALDEQTSEQVAQHNQFLFWRPWLVYAGVGLFGIAAALGARQLWRHPGTRDTPQLAVATGWLGAGLLLLLLGNLTQETRIGIIGFGLGLVGWAWASGGRRWARAATFPVVLLLSTMPLGFLSDELATWLRFRVIEVTHTVANWAGLDVVRQGTQLSNAAGTFQYDVAPACSGIRSLIALVVLSLLVGYFGFRALWRRIFFIALALPLAFFGNCVRISSIILAGHFLGHDAGTWVHDNLGMVAFLVVLGMSLGTMFLMRRFLPERPRPEANASAPGEVLPVVEPRGAGVWQLAGAVGGVGLAGMVAVIFIQQAQVVNEAGLRLAEDGINPVALPTRAGERQSIVGTRFWGRELEVSRIEREVLPADTGFAKMLYEDRDSQFLRRGEPTDIAVSIVLSGRDRTSIHRPELCLPGQGHNIVKSSIVELPVPSFQGGKLRATVLDLGEQVIDVGGGRRLHVPAIYVYWFVSPDYVVPTTEERRILGWLERLQLRINRWAYVALFTHAAYFPSADPVEQAERKRLAREAALARVSDLVAATLPSFQKTAVEVPLALAASSPATAP